MKLAVFTIAIILIARLIHPMLAEILVVVLVLMAFYQLFRGWCNYGN